MTSLNMDYLTVFFLVLALEIPLAWHRGLNNDAPTRRRWESLGLLQIATLVTLANALSHPLVFFGFMASGRPYLWAALSGQICAVLMKASVFRWAASLGFWPALQIAFWCTLVSWQIAPLLLFWAYN